MKVGDRVSVLDDDIYGEVVAVCKNAIRISTQDGFEMEFDKSELVIMNSPLSKLGSLDKNIHKAIKDKQFSKKKKSIGVKPKQRTQPTMEVDLHIHHLVASERGLTNYDMLTIQVDTAKRQLEFAIAKKIQRVVFIHGVGEGVLRQELETLFRRYDQVKMEDADFKKYGRGATEIYIFQNF